MIRVGGNHILKVCCPECGTPQQQPGVSDFFFICCQNETCNYRGANVVIERRTGLVISCDAVLMFDKEGEWKRAFPALYNDSGERVWPKNS